MDIDFKAVRRQNWQDFEALFESKGGPHYCWCTAWRKFRKPLKLQQKVKEKPQCEVVLNH